MKRPWVAGVVALLFALDWAALHDIIEGESNPYAEYVMVAVSIVALGVMFLVWLRRTRAAWVQRLTDFSCQ